MTLYEELQRRELIAQSTDEEEIKKLINEGNSTFYIGFDATADSLHVGHLLQIIVMKRMQMNGHKPIALLGTGTTLVGDPTGRTDMRKMLTEQEIELNAQKFKEQISKFIDFDKDKAIMVKNGDWLKKLNYIEFLREVGKYFSVNKMLTAECVKSRLENGLSFLEFNYMLMQSYDFLKLYDKYNCILELGGDDQWSNILGGIDLVRRVKSKKVYGLTFSLLTTKDGKKMGKSANGAIWLDKNKCSPYDFFQYFRNIDDDDVFTTFKKLTFIPIEEIEKWEKENKDINKYKEMLSYELTKLVHGEEEANKALSASKALFTNNVSSKDMPTTKIDENELENGKIGILKLMTLSKLASSNGEARRLINQGGVVINDKKLEDPSIMIDKEELTEGIRIKKGKKTFMLVKI